MIDVFNIANTAPQDKSIEFLSRIFGLMSGVLDNPANPVTVDSSNMVSQMFRTFNTVMLAVGALIVVYVIVVGAMKTAHEGEAMGKQWSSMWIPIRIVLGIAGLFPTAAGYCIVQVVMMWVVVQGIGAADSLWNTVLAYVNTLGSPYAAVSMPSTGVSNSFRDLFKAITCDATLRRTDATPQQMFGPNAEATAGGQYFCRGAGGVDKEWCNSSPAFNKDALPPEVLGSNPVRYSTEPLEYKLGPGGVCGTLKYCNKQVACPNNMNPSSNEATMACRACDEQINILENIVTQQRDIAQKFVQADFDYRQFYNLNPSSKAAWISQYCAEGGMKCCISDTDPNCMTNAEAANNFPSPNGTGQNAFQNAGTDAVTDLLWPFALQNTVKTNFIQLETDTYLGRMQQVISKLVEEKAAAQPVGTVDPLVASAGKNGWLYAGAYYYVVGKSNTANQAAGLPTIQMSIGSYTDFNVTKYVNERINNVAAKDLVVAMQAQMGNVTTGEGGPTTSSYTASRGKGIGGDKHLGDIGNLVGELQSDLNSISKTGMLPSDTNPIFAIQAMGFALLIALEIFFALFLIATVILGLIGNINVFVAGNAVMDPIGPMATLVYIVLIPAIYGLMGIMATYGGLLGVYVPLIPFMIFTASAITWFLLVIEAMVAGPLVAIGVMMPGGHHDVMGRAEPALMMLLNIFLRPSLMIFGLMIGMLLSTVLCQLIFYTFWSIFIPKAGDPGAAFLAWVFYMGAFIALVVAAVNKSYAAIYMLPDRVITWIGGHATQGGEAEMASEGKHAIEGGARGMGAAAQTTGGAMKGAKDAANQQAHFKAQTGAKGQAEADAWAAKQAGKDDGDDKGKGGDGGNLKT